MKKNTILFLLTIFTVIFTAFYIINGNTSTAYGNTFSMPESSNSDDNYHSYSLQNKEKDNINKYNINNSNNTSSQNNSNTTNTTDTNDTKQENNFDNVYNPPIENKTPKPTIKPVPETKPTIKPTIKPTHKPKKKSKPKNKNNNINFEKITQIEFFNHFIKLPVGNTKNIAFKTKPDNLLSTKFIYKSLDTSIVIFNNKKVTGLKKGFTTVVIMLPDGTVKAACPIKVI